MMFHKILNNFRSTDLDQTIMGKRSISDGTIKRKKESLEKYPNLVTNFEFRGWKAV